jgi:hypothetical protein
MAAKARNDMPLSLTRSSYFISFFSKPFTAISRSTLSLCSHVLPCSQLLLQSTPFLLPNVHLSVDLQNHQKLCMARHLNNYRQPSLKKIKKKSEKFMAYKPSLLLCSLFVTPR